MRRALRVGAAAIVAVTAACGTPSPTGTTQAPPGWTRLPDSPLSPRTSAVTAWTGHEVVVVGGTEFLCRDTAECIPPDDPPLRDGAAFDISAGSWRQIAAAPAGIHAERPAVVGGDVYVLTCVQQQCDSDGQLLRYRSADDAWDTLPGPPVQGFYTIAPFGDDLLAYSPSDEAGEVPDWRFDTGDEAWQELPADPLPPSYDRHIVSVDGDLMVFAKPIDPASNQHPSAMIGARLDAATGTWTELPTAPTSGFQAWALDGIVVVNPHFTGARGGIFEPATGEWGPLPDPPTAPSWDGDMAGALGADTAEFEHVAGWVLDVPSSSWIEIPRLDDRVHPEVGATAVGRSLFVVGGERWSSGSEGELLDDAWLWTPPPPASRG